MPSFSAPPLGAADAASIVDTCEANSGETDEQALAFVCVTAGDAVAADLITIFLEYAPTRVGAFAEAVATGDRRAAGRALHSLRNGASQLGAARVAALCLAGEQVLAAGAPVDRLGALTVDLEWAYRRAALWLREQRRTLE